jgi:CBS domain-containing protein
MYPEARYSPCGITSYLPESLGYLVKRAGVPVVVIIHRGNHLASPFWGFRRPRKVPLHTTATLTLTPEQIEKMTPAEINEALKKAFVYDDYTIRQALEKMEAAGYAALPILNRRGEYRGTITEGDLLWALKNLCYMDMRQAEARRIAELDRRRDNIPVRVNTNMRDLIDRASTQNFVPVVDDYDTFIGIVTRSAIIRYCSEQLFQEN